MKIKSDEFANIFNVEKNVAYGVLRFLAEKQLCKTSKAPQPKGMKGKPAIFYILEDDVGPKLVELLQKKLGNLNELSEAQPDNNDVVATPTSGSDDDNSATTPVSA